MAVVNTGLTTKGLRSTFFERFDAMTRARLYERAATRVQSDTASEIYRFLGQAPSMREMGTGRLVKDFLSESYTIENAEYEATVEVKRSEVDDDQTGQIRMRIEEMADRAAMHKDKLLANLLINGATAGNLSYDQVTFFNAAHVSGESGSQTNLSTNEAADATSLPTVAEMKIGIQGAISAMRVLVDDTGEPLFLSESGLLLVVPPALEWVAREALNAAMIASTNNVMVGMPSCSERGRRRDNGPS